MKFSLKSSYPALLLASLAVVQLAAAPGHYLGQEHDDAQYVLSSLSLIRGRYSLGILPGDPALTFNTPGWPLLLTPAAAVSGDSPAGYQLWSWAWLALCDVLVWAWLRRRLRGPTAAAATALFALNPLVLSRSGVAMSEVPFLAFALLLLLVLESAPAWAAGGLLAWCWLIRPAALPLFPAVGLYYFFSGRRRDLLACAAAAALPVLLWKAWVGAHGDQLAELSELALAWSGRGPGEILRYAAGNMRSAAALWGASSLPWLPSPDYSGAGLAWGILLAGAAAWGAARSGRGEGYEPAAAYLGFGVLMHAAWPWWYERYLVPYIPFLVWGAAKSLEGRFKRFPAAAALGALAALSLAGQGRLLLRTDPGRYRPELSGTYAWIRGNTPASALFASALYCRDAFYAGRPFESLPGPEARKLAGGGLRPLAQVLRARRVRYVLWQDLPDLGSSLGEKFPWSAALRSLKEDLSRPPFRSAYLNEAEHSELYELR